MPAAQVDTFGQPISQTLPGAMPTGGVLNAPMDLGFGGESTMSGLDFGNTDMNWMDFERILEDMNNPAANVTLGDMQWPQNVPQGQDWPCALHQNLM